MARVLLVEEGGRGGVADYTSALAGGLAAAGWRVDVATARDHAQPAPPPGVRRHGVYAYARAPSLRRTRLSRPVNGALHAAAVAPLVALARRADIVHAQGDGEWPPLFAATLRALRATRRPLVWTPHNTFARGAAHARAWAAMYAAADRVVVHARSDIAAVPGDARGRTRVLPMGELGAFATAGAPRVEPTAARARLGLPVDALVVALIGVLRPDKGLDHLLAAARDVPQVHLLVAGEDAGALGPAAALLGEPALAGRLTLREGWIEPAALPAYLAATDVVAVPYVRASQSASLLLAYGAGRPVIAYPVGGLPEVVEHGRTGWVTERPEPAALAAVLREAVAAGRGRLHEMGADARALAAERWSWTAIGRRTGELYRELLA